MTKEQEKYRPDNDSYLSERHETEIKIAETAISKAQGYIRRIRNKRKQEYAAAYFGHLQGLLDHEPNSHDYDIRPMTAQGVRWELEKILGT